MKLRKTPLAAALSLIPSGQLVILGTITVLTTNVITLSATKAYAESSALHLQTAVEKRVLLDNKAALLDLNKAIEINPKNARAYSERGYIKWKLQDKEGGLADLNKSIEINPKDSTSYTYRAGIKQELEDHEGALLD